MTAKVLLFWSVATTVGMSFALTPADAWSASPTADAQQDTTVEAVVVTAQRREEKIQRVPVTISVVTARDVAAAGAVDTYSLSSLVPGLNVTQAGPAVTPYLRGIGSNVIEEGDENSVAVYVNSILQISPNAALFSLSNIARIEVLKGPQGTLFGRNADGGVINIITATPSQKPSATASIGYGNYSTVEGTLYATTGVTKNLATDISIYANNQSGGWGRNFFYDRPEYRSYNYTVRNSWLWTPTDDLTVSLEGGYSRYKDNSLAMHPAEGTVGIDGVTGFKGMYNVDINTAALVSKRSWDVGLHATYDLKWARLNNITGYSDVATSRPDDSDNTPINFEGGPLINTTDRGVTEEIQLQSEPKSPITWIGGFYYLNATSGYAPPGYITIVGTVFGGLPYLILKGTETTHSYAGFGQATATVLPATHLTLGGRYTSDTRSIDGQEVLPSGPLPSSIQSATFNKFTYKVTLDHQFGENVMAYVTNSTGFKAGQYNLVSASDPPVKPEEVKAYEGGIKTSWFGNRLQIDAAGYHYDYSNIQANVYGSGSAVVTLINAARARVNGADVDLAATPIARLHIHSGLSYVDGKYVSFPGAPLYQPLPTGGASVTPGDATGRDMIKAPKWQWSVGGDYSIPVGEGRVGLSANYSYQSSFYWDFGNAFQASARKLLTASLSWSPNETYEIRFWGRNLLNEQYAIAGEASNFGFDEAPGPPRTYGVTLDARF